MASRPPPSPPPPTTPTTINSLGDDLLREIFLRLPSLPSLVRAAFACRAFRRAVRSSPAFRRSFRKLHAPPLLALFLEPNFEVVPASPCRWRRFDPDLVDADFFDIRLSRHGDAKADPPSADGSFILDKVSGGTKGRSSYSYNPVTQALDLFLYHPRVGVDIDLQFYTLSSQDHGQGPSRVVCLRHHRRWREQVAVFSSDTMKWKIFPRSTLPLREYGYRTGTVMMRGIIWWQNWMYDQIVVLDTATFRFSLIAVPTPLMTEWDESTYKLGETKDEKLCIVDIKDKTLVSFSLRAAADDDGVVERWVLYREFPLGPIVKNGTGYSMEEEGYHVRVELVAVIDGFVYLSIFYCEDEQSSCEMYLSLCLETSEMSELFKDAYRYNEEVDPYLMAWPVSLLQSKEESETEFTSDSVADDGPVHTEKASSVLVAALQSLSQVLMDDSESNKEIVADLDAFLLDSNKETVAELQAFLRSDEDEGGSLMSKIAYFDAQLVTARDRILRIRE